MARNPPPEPSMATTGTWNDERQTSIEHHNIGPKTSEGTKNKWFLQKTTNELMVAAGKDGGRDS